MWSMPRKDAGVRRFINMCQNGATPDHFSRFLRSKGRAQQYVAQSGLQWTAVRPSVIFGAQDEFFNAFARLIRLTPLVFPLIGGGTALFQPVSVHDVVEAMVLSLDDEGTIGREFELGGPEVLTMAEIEKRVLKAMDTSRIMINAPVGLLRPAVWVMEKTLPGAPVNSTLLDLLKAAERRQRQRAGQLFQARSATLLPGQTSTILRTRRRVPRSSASLPEQP